MTSWRRNMRRYIDLLSLATVFYEVNDRVVLVRFQVVLSVVLEKGPLFYSLCTGVVKGANACHPCPIVGQAFAYT